MAEKTRVSLLGTKLATIRFNREFSSSISHSRSMAVGSIPATFFIPIKASRLTYSGFPTDLCSCPVVFALLNEEINEESLLRVREIDTFMRFHFFPGSGKSSGIP